MHPPAAPKFPAILSYQLALCSFAGMDYEAYLLLTLNRLISVAESLPTGADENGSWGRSNIQ